MLDSIIDPDPHQRRDCGRLYPHVESFAQLEQLPWERIDGVIIASPVERHVYQAMTVLGHRKHCLVEKPLALEIADVEELAEAARSAGRVLLTGHILDYHPAAQELLARCRAGQLGELRYWHSARGRLVPRRQFVSVLHELLWHDIGLLLRLVGRLPEGARSVGRCDEDGAIMLDFGDFYATLRGSQIQPLRESQVVVCGTAGSLLFDDEQAFGENLRLQSREGLSERIRTAATEPLTAEIDHFLDAAAGGRLPISGPEHAIQILQVIELVTRQCTATLR